MKTKFLLFSAILFFILGRHYHDELVFYFFSLMMIMLFFAVIIHKRELRLRARLGAESLPDTDTPK
jgi:hypothetical protein